MAKKQRKIEKMEDFRRNELIQIIRIYNKGNAIKNYHKKNKKQLIEAINKHIIVSEDYKTIEGKPFKKKISTYDKYEDKKIDKKLSLDKERKLYRDRGRLKAVILKLKEEIAEMDIEIDGNYKLRNDKDYMKTYNDKKEELKIEQNKLKTISNLIKKNEELNKKK